MKKTLILLALMVAAFCSQAFAQTKGLGVYVGDFVLLGVQTQDNNLRFAAHIGRIQTNDNAFGVGIDSILDTSRLSGKSANKVDFYYGVGLSAGFWEGNGNSGINILPHGTLGVLFTLDNLEKLPFYLEFQPGLSFNNTESQGFYSQGLRVPFRFGIIFK